MAIATLLTMIAGQEEATEILSKTKKCQKSRPYEAKRSLFQLGLKRIKAYLLQIRKPPEQWSLEGWEEDNWSEQMCQHHVCPVLVAKG